MAKDGLRFDKIIVCHSLSIKCSRFPNYKSTQWLDIVASENCEGFAIF